MAKSPQYQPGYAPYVQNGPYEKEFSTLGEDVFRFGGAVMMGTISPSSDPALLSAGASGSGLIGLSGEKVGASIGGEIGRLIDNISVIENNIGVFNSQVNSPEFWGFTYGN